MRGAISALLVAMGAFCGPPHALGQSDITAEAELNETRLTPGMATFLQVRIKGGIPDDIPNTIPAAGLTIEKAGVTFNDVIVAGRQTLGTQILYSVVGDREGRYEIPAISFRFRGEEVRTQPLAIEVAAGGGDAIDTSRPFFMSFRAEKTEAYLHELVPVELKLYVRGTNSIARAGRPKFENASKFVIKPFPSSYKTELVQIDGLPYTTVRFPTRVAALQPGEHVFGPAVTEAAIARPIHSLLPRTMGRFNESQSVTSNDLTFAIKPLPEEGRPESFRGAVGRFEMSVEADPQELWVGDPVSVRIRIRGTGNFDSLRPPEFEELAGWRTYPVTREEDTGSGAPEQTVVFSQVLLPLEEHRSLPGLELAFFDPDEERYVVQASAPIPVTIRQELGASTGGGGRRMSIPSDELDRLLEIETGGARWVPVAAVSGAWPAGMWWQSVPLVIFGALAGFSWRRRQRERRAEREERERHSVKRLEQRFQGRSVTREEFFRMSLEHLERLGGFRASPDGERGLSKQAVAALQRLEQEGNAALYAGSREGSLSERAKPQEIRAVLQALRELEVWQTRNA